MNPTSPPVNLIILNVNQQKSKEDIIEDYIEILKSCKTGTEFYQCLSMLYDDAVIKTGELILEKQIQKNVEILEELRK
jgi:hypothetical protein